MSRIIKPAGIVTSVNLEARLPTPRICIGFQEGGGTLSRNLSNPGVNDADDWLLSTGWGVGSIGHALQGPGGGVSGGVGVGEIDWLSGSTSFTMFVVARPDATTANWGNEDTLLGKWSSGSQVLFRLGHENDGRLEVVAFDVANRFANYVIGTDIDGETHTFACSLYDGTLSAYYDGAVGGLTVSVGALSTSTGSQLVVGNADYLLGTDGFDGLIYFVAIFDIGLTDAQIRTLHSRWTEYLEPPSDLPSIIASLGGGGDLTVSMQPAEATGAALTLTPVPAAITVSMQPAEATGAALTLTPVPAAITVSMQPAEATADAVTLTPVPAAITVSMQPAEATADAVTLTPVPAAITVSMQTVGATGAALSLSVNDGAVSTLKLVVITPVISEIKPEIWDPGINFEHPLTQDLLAHWPMWEQGGDKVKDVSGNRNHFTINGMPRVTSRIGIGLQQSDDGDELTSTTPVVIPGNTDFTYIWRGVIISYSSSLSYLWANTGSDRIAFAAGSGFPAIMINNIWALNPGSGYEVPTGELVTLAFVIKADYWAGFYANGILQHSNFFSRGRPDTLIYTFGWSVVTDRRITGTWVSHSLYNAALTSSAVAQLSTDPDQFTRKSSITLPVIAELSNLIVSMSTTEAIGAAPSLTIKSDLTVSMSTIETIAAAPALTVIPAAVIVSMSIAEAIAAAPTINVGNIVKVTMGTAEAIADSLLLSVGVGATQVSLDIATAIGEAVALNLIPGAVVPLMGTATLTGEALSINVGNIVKVTMGVAEAIGEAHSLIMAPGVVTLPMAVSCAIGAATSLFIRSDETVQMSTAAAIAAAPTFTVQISYGGFYETTNNAIRGQVLDNVETTLGLSVKYPNAPFSNPATKWVELNIDHDETTLVSKGGGSRLRTFGICRLTVWSLLEQGEKSALETIDAMIPSFRIQALSNYPFGSVMMGVPSVGQSSRVDDWFTTELNCPFYCDRIIG